MITPGVAASLTPTSLERRERHQRAGWLPRLHLPRVRVHLPHPHAPHRHA